MKECRICGGVKTVRGMGGMKETCKECNGSGTKVEPVIIVKKTRKARKTDENTSTL